MLSSAARLVGGPLGGLVLGLRGIDGVVLADAATFAVVVALLALRPPRASGAARGAGARGRLARDWAEGFAVVSGTPVLRRTLAVVPWPPSRRVRSSCCSCCSSSATSGQRGDVGVLRGVQAIGSLAGGVLLTRRSAAGPRAPAAVSLAVFGVLSLLTWNGPR